jgi:hypothetical protein
MAGSMGHDAGSRKLGLDVPRVRNGDESFLGPHGGQVEVEGRGVCGEGGLNWYSGTGLCLYFYPGRMTAE